MNIELWITTSLSIIFSIIAAYVAIAFILHISPSLNSSISEERK